MRRITLSLMVGVVLTLLLAVALNAQGVRQNFEWIIAKRLTVDTSASIGTDLTVGDDVTVTGDVTADGLTLTSVGTIDTLRLSAATAISVTQGLTITPAGSYQPLESAGTVSTGAITAGTAGDVLTLVNGTNTTITISDTGTLKLSGNIALGQYDSLVLISDGTNWVQLATTNN